MKTSKISALVLIIGLIFSGYSCDRGITVDLDDEKIELKGFEAVEGKHCESTAIMNALNYQGVPLNEAMINGFAGSISFAFITEGGFPFLGGRTMTFLENLSKTTGLKYVEVKPETSQQAYDEGKKILKKNIPVILRVDMRYLPYLWNGEYGDKYTSFGWHFVTLIKLDESGGYAWVTETSEKGIHSIKKIKIADLMKARGSKEGMLKADNYFYYFPEPKSTKINYAAALNSSLEIVLDNYEKKGGVLEGLKKLPDQLKNIEDFISSKYVLEPLFFTFHGYIETFGTGGAAFRNYYRDFLLEAGKITNNPKTKIAASQLDETCKKWENLAAEFSYISKNIKQHYGDKKKRNDLYQKASLLAEELYIAESRFASELRKAYKPL